MPYFLAHTSNWGVLCILKSAGHKLRIFHGSILMSDHQFHLSPHSLRNQYLVEKIYFPFLGGTFFLSKPMLSIALYLTNTRWMWFGRGPSFLTSPWVFWICTNWIMTTICSFLTCLFLPYESLLISNSKYCHHGTSQPHQLAPHIYHVNFNDGVFQNKVDLIHFIKRNPLHKLQCPTL